jgi:threonine synthase
MTAIDPAYDALDEWTLIDKLSEITDTELPPAIKDIKDAEVLHKTECATADMQKTVEDIISKQF